MDEFQKALDSLNNSNLNLLRQIEDYRESLKRLSRVEDKQYEALSEISKSLEEAIEAIVELG